MSEGLGPIPDPLEPIERCSTGPANDFQPFLPEEIEQSLPDRFERQAARYPDRIAVKGRRGELTYDVLNRLANRVGHALLAARGVGAEPVGLLLEKDAPMAGALIGILKAGKMYVPLDPAHPGARTSKMLDDAGAKLVVTDGANEAAARALAGHARTVLDVGRLDPGLSERNLGLSLGPDSLAYIIYTSGSTGEPKGVVQSHRNVLHNIMRHTNALHVSADDRLTLLGSFGTGQAVTDIYCALLNGARLCPFNLKVEGLHRLVGWLKAEEISIYHSSASIFRHLVDALGATRDFPSVREVKLGSEPILERDVELCRRHFAPDCLFVNALSSTEAGLLREVFIDKDTVIRRVVVPVGFPVEGMEILLLDDVGRAVADGAVGEIVVRSRYLTPGYWGRPELTEAAFQRDPSGGNARMYHTGDMGRMSPRGCLEYLGRKDLQVKIRVSGSRWPRSRRHSSRIAR